MRTLVIIVNYHSVRLTHNAVQSVLNSDSAGPVDVVVIDNSADNNQAVFLKETLVGLNARIIFPDQNLGFGRACNLALKNVSCDAVLLLNPDAVLLPKALSRMQKSLFALQNAGAVGPQIFWDEGLSFYLPPSYPPNLYLWQPVLHSWGFNSLAYKVVKGLWRRFSIKVWSAETPVKVPALSGGHILLKREAIAEAGGLFDPRFFMYFEDTDLCKRLKTRGYSLYVVPGAEAVHAYGGCGGDNCRDLKKNWMRQSKQIFTEKHLSSKSRFFQGVLARSGSLKVESVGPVRFTSPFVLEIPAKLRKEWLFEWSPSPDFIPCAGKFGSGAQLEFTKNLWDILRPGEYFGRIGKPYGLFPEFVTFSWKKI